MFPASLNVPPYMAVGKLCSSLAARHNQYLEYYIKLYIVLQLQVESKLTSIIHCTTCVPMNSIVILASLTFHFTLESITAQLLDYGIIELCTA